jgi:hypothetical protein
VVKTYLVFNVCAGFVFACYVGFSSEDGTIFLQIFEEVLLDMTKLTGSMESDKITICFWSAGICGRNDNLDGCERQ